MVKKEIEQLSLFGAFGPTTGPATPRSASAAAAPIEAETAVPVEEPGQPTPDRASAMPGGLAPIVAVAGDHTTASSPIASAAAGPAGIPPDGVAFRAWSYSGYRLTAPERLRDALAKYEQLFGCVPPLVAVPLGEAGDYARLATPAMAVVPQPSVPRDALFLQLPAGGRELRRVAMSDGEDEE